MAFSKLINILKQIIFSLEAKVEKKFVLKCLIAKDADDISWELVLYAPWLDEDETKRVSFIYENIVSKIDASVIIDFSGVIPAVHEDDMIRTLLETRRNATGKVILDNETIFQVNYPFAKLIIFLD
jgi:fructose-1-phosphate kinase PfkB-like protein